MAIDKGGAARTALALVDQAGLDRLTVRRLAGELGVQAPALYWHFENKRALLDEMTDVLLAPTVAGLRPPTPAESWWQWLESTLTAMRAALLARRDGARIAAGADITRTRALGELLELLVTVLHAAGFSLADASRITGTLVQFVIGRTLEEQSRPDSEAELAAISGPDFPYPVLADSLRERHNSPQTADDDFRFSMDIVITGLRVVHDKRE